MSPRPRRSANNLAGADGKRAWIWPSRPGHGPAGRRDCQDRRRIHNKKPRKKFVGARTEEYALAAYLDAWKQKIERIGT